MCDECDDDNMTDDEIDAELKRRGIDITRAYATVRAALVETRKRNGRCEHCGGELAPIATRLMGRCRTLGCKGQIESA